MNALVTAKAERADFACSTRPSNKKEACDVRFQANESHTV